uniref:Ion_trans domain-containing protein n=1 Tax=Macrostomum lignano TaxID=282301 RepID=A0A1I8G4R8_9PLAT
MSLLGKPINLKSARQDARYRRLQARVYNFLERPKTWQSITYHVIVFASVFICLVFSVLSTMSNCVRDAALKPSLTAPGQPTGAPGACSKFAFKYSEVASEILFYMETGMLFWFFTEYCLRMWSAGCRSRYQTWRGRLLFARRPFCIVDSIVIVASIIVLALGSDRQMFAASALRGLRFFQILRMIRMDRRGGSWKLLASVVWAHRQELFTTVYIGFLGLIFSSFVMYLIEKDEQDTQISNYADALWWGVTVDSPQLHAQHSSPIVIGHGGAVHGAEVPAAEAVLAHQQVHQLAEHVHPDVVATETPAKLKHQAHGLAEVTLCTVGYGDVTPKTWSGKIVASFCSIAGISFFALPAGILGSGFALKVQQHQRQKHLIRRRVPAATLIQSLWRCYAADPSSTSMATWKPHMRPLRSPSSKFGRLSTIKRNKSERTHASGSYTPIRRNAMPDLDPANPQAAAEVAFAVG